MGDTEPKALDPQTAEQIKGLMSAAEEQGQREKHCRQQFEDLVTMLIANVCRDDPRGAVAAHLRNQLECAYSLGKAAGESSITSKEIVSQMEMIRDAFRKQDERAERDIERANTMLELSRSQVELQTRQVEAIEKLVSRG